MNLKEQYYYNCLNEVFAEFPRLKVKVDRVCQGSTVFRCYLTTPPAIEAKHIIRYADYIARELKLEACPTIQTIYKEGSIVLDIPNTDRVIVDLREKITDPVFVKMIENGVQLPYLLGMDNSNNLIGGDLADAPHMLFSGTTNSGKSVAMRVVLNSILAAHAFVNRRLIGLSIIDPKGVEFINYRNSFYSHLYGSDPESIRDTLIKTVRIMERTYKILSQYADNTGRQCTNIFQYNQAKLRSGGERELLPYTIVVIDELADILVVDPELESLILRLVQKGRAAGIHCLLSTQRPSHEIISGPVRANVPVKICCKVARPIDARVVFGDSDWGAHHLLGRGDMLYQDNQTSEPIRMQGIWTDEFFMDDVRYCYRTEYGKIVPMDALELCPTERAPQVIEFESYRQDDLSRVFKTNAG